MNIRGFQSEVRELVWYYNVYPGLLGCQGINYEGVHHQGRDWEPQQHQIDAVHRGIHIRQALLKIPGFHNRILKSAFLERVWHNIVLPKRGNPYIDCYLVYGPFLGGVIWDTQTVREIKTAKKQDEAKQQAERRLIAALKSYKRMVTDE